MQLKFPLGRQSRGLRTGRSAVGPSVFLQAFPLPVEGTETSVMADDPRVSEYMAELQESLEKVCGPLRATHTPLAGTTMTALSLFLPLLADTKRPDLRLVSFAPV